MNYIPIVSWRDASMHKYDHMGKVTGFMEFDRQDALERPALQRIADWQEMHVPMHEAALHEQSARCMDCGVPYCTNGVEVNKATTGCPINNEIPEFNDLVHKGLWQQALHRLHKTNNFPEFTGRVCPAPCESACVLGINAASVTIKSLELAIIERGFAEGWVKANVPKQRSGKSVAIIGSGPAGLACADQLNKVGHAVTVFERDQHIGGLLMYGIPNMKLDKKCIVHRRVQLLQQAGIQFVTQAHVGVTHDMHALQQQFDAVVLCCGATVARQVPVPGHDLQGVHDAMQYLTAATEHIMHATSVPQHLHAAGKHVVVIGGGDTAVDCIGTALRQGCISIAQLSRMPALPLKRAAHDEWPAVPQIHRSQYAHAEAAAKFGQDCRMYNVMAMQYVGNDLHEVMQVQVQQVQWTSLPHGSSTWAAVPHTQHTLPAQLVLLAQGFVGPEKTLIDAMQLSTDTQGNVQAQHGKFLTNVPGTFVAGDMRRGQSLVVWAINEGRGAARECDRFLMGKTHLP